jgi:calcineurin-like phosphoesterase family protein
MAALSLTKLKSWMFGNAESDVVDIWFISDTHFGGSRIIEYCGRPFASTEEMDEAMIANWNAVVKQHDHVYHLGDFARSEKDLERVIVRLNGQKRIVLGNHDDEIRPKVLAKYFGKVLMWRLFKPFVCTHVPLRLESFGKATYNVHGHIHNNPPVPGPYLNVSVEAIGYRPIHYDEVIRRANERQ